MKNLFESLWVFSTVIAFSAFLVCLPAFSKGMYDQKAVLCHDVAKIKTFKTDIVLDPQVKEEEIMGIVFEYLKNQSYVQKNLKGEDSLFFVSMKRENIEDEQELEKFKINRIYHVKNPEQILMAIDADMTEDEIFNTQLVAEFFEMNLKSKAAISEKIDKVDRSFTRKITEGSISSIIGLNNIMPLNPVRPLVNFLFGVFHTNNKEVYDKILDEVADMKKGKKNYKIYVMPYDV